MRSSEDPKFLLKKSILTVSLLAILFITLTGSGTWKFTTVDNGTRAKTWYSATSIHFLVIISTQILFGRHQFTIQFQAVSPPNWIAVLLPLWKLNFLPSITLHTETTGRIIVDFGEENGRSLLQCAEWWIFLQNRVACVSHYYEYYRNSDTVHTTRGPSIYGYTHSISWRRVEYTKTSQF